MEMTYTKAVEMIKSGDPVDYNRGYEYLYYATYNVNKWDIEKILGNEQDAEDVLQVAYIKMLETIHTLKDPEKFPAWFGKIATNKAIDVYRSRRTSKKDDGSDETYRKTISFSELEYTDGDGETVEYEWEDESLEFRPEEAYTQNETVEMVHEMLKNMPEEQKACLVMFHLQGLSIKEIAEEMQISENTVKSRLNYARKNIEAQGEELKKKGYQLYSVAPLPLLLYLLRMQRGAAAATDSYWAATAVSNWSLGAGAATAVGEAGAVGAEAGTSLAGTVATESAGAQVAGAVSAEGAGTLGAGAVTGQGGAVSTATVTGQAGITVASNATAQVAKTAGKKVAGGFLGTLGGKIAAIVGAIAVVVGGAFVIDKIVNDKEETPTTEQVVESTEEISGVTTEATTEEAVDERTLLTSYYQDTLVPEYGLFPEYQANENKGDAKFEGILCSDIDDYNQDGVLDLFVMRNYNERLEDNGQFKQVNQDIELYTIKDGQVSLVGINQGENRYYMLPNEYMNPLSSLGGVYHAWKVKVDGKIYVMESGHGYYTNSIAGVYLYTYDTDKIQCVRTAGTGDGANNGVFVSGYEYENGTQVVERALSDDAEAFFGELGITCSIERHGEGIITFENENSELYTLYNGIKNTDDISVQLVSSNVEVSDETTDAATDEKALLEAFLQDELVAQTGYFPEYQENANGEATYNGILLSDIDDYNQDGVLDLYVVTNAEKEYNDQQIIMNCIEHHDLYTIKDGEVVVLGQYEQETSFSVAGKSSNKPASMCKQIDQMWKVNVDNQIYFIEKQSPYYGGSKFVAVYTYDNGKMQPIRIAYRDSGSLWGTYWKGCIYSDGTMSEERKLELEEGGGTSAENFFAEIGISCTIYDSAENSENYIEFVNEAELIYELHNAGKSGNEDQTVQFTFNKAITASSGEESADDGKAAQQRDMLATYFKDRLVTSHGYMPQHQSSVTTSAPILDGIYCSDIDDYNGDGNLDLLVCRYDNKNHYPTGIVVNEWRTYDEYRELYTVQGDGIVLISSEVSEIQRYLDGNNSFYCEIINATYKVKVDGKIYLIKYITEPSSKDAGRQFLIYTHEDYKFQLVRRLEAGPGMDEALFYWGEEYVDGVSQGVRQLYVPEGGIGFFRPDEYGESENITEEDFLAEIGIICNIDGHTGSYPVGDIITIESEHELLYEVGHCIHDSGETLANYKKVEP